jgi:hypothetical protein
MIKIAAFRRASQVKRRGVEVEREVFTPKKTWVEQSMAETLDIDMCLTSRTCEQVGCWRNRVFCGNFKTFVNCG